MRPWQPGPAGDVLRRSATGAAAAARRRSGSPGRVGAGQQLPELRGQRAEGGATVADRVLLRGGKLPVGTALGDGVGDEQRVVAETVVPDGLVDDAAWHLAADHHLDASGGHGGGDA